MSLSTSVSLSNSLLLQQQGQVARLPMTASECNEQQARAKGAANPENVTPTSRVPVQEQGTKVVAEKNEAIENGTRRTRTFEQENGRQFTRIEELVSTARGSKKTVVQQNPSGSITRYEEVLDREEGGTFRRTQRFQDQSGEQVAQITPGYAVKDPFVLTGGAAPLSFNAPSPFESSRGTQLDLSV